MSNSKKIQFDPPRDAKFFVHRAGRAARAGKRGESVLFLTPGEDENNYRDFLSRNQKVGELKTDERFKSDGNFILKIKNGNNCFFRTVNALNFLRSRPDRH